MRQLLLKSAIVHADESHVLVLSTPNTVVMSRFLMSNNNVQASLVHNILKHATAWCGLPHPVMPLYSK